MGNIILAVVIAVGSGAVLYAFATVCGFPAEIAKGVAGIPAFAIQKVYEFLEARSVKRGLAQTGHGSSISLEEFSIHPLSGFLLCVVMTSGMISVTGALMGALVEMAAAADHTSILGSQPKLFALLVAITALPLRVVAAAYIGRWIGNRSRRYGVAVLICGIVVGGIASFLVGVFIMGEEWFKVISGDERTASAMFMQFLTVVPDIVVYIISGALGFWYGRRHRLASYLTFVMKILPQDTRETIIEMARDEAMRVHSATMQLRAS